MSTLTHTLIPHVSTLTHTLILALPHTTCEHTDTHPHLPTATLSTLVMTPFSDRARLRAKMDHTVTQTAANSLQHHRPASHLESHRPDPQCPVCRMPREQWSAMVLPIPVPGVEREDKMGHCNHCICGENTQHFS